MSGERTNILGFVGSLRRESFNRSLMQNFVDALPAHADYTEASISDLPHFNADVLNQHGLPPNVRELVDQANAADAIVFATPEYNFSVPGALKNAIDWISRHKPSPFGGKPVAIMSASTSLLGGVRAQYHLRQILVFLDAHPINKPEVFLANAASKLDEHGRLTDDVAVGLVKDLVGSLMNWRWQLAAEPTASGGQEERT